MGFMDSLKKVKNTDEKKSKPLIPPNRSNSLLYFSDSWESFPKELYNWPRNIQFDRAVDRLDKETKKKYPHSLEIKVQYSKRDPKGFPEDDGKELINVVENCLTPGPYDIRLIGIMTGAYCCQFVFCCGNGIEKNFKKAVKTIMGKKKGSFFAYRDFPNDDFKLYRDLIAPSKYDYNWIDNRILCDNLEKSGESFKKPRDMSFSIYFSSTDHIQAVSEKLQKFGFHEAGRGTNEKGEYSLDLKRKGVPDIDNITKLTNGILDALEGTDGYFDGWSSSIIEKKET